jgi:hypothetical protein
VTSRRPPGPSEEICRVHDQDDVNHSEEAAPSERSFPRRFALGGLASAAGAALAALATSTATAQTDTTAPAGSVVGVSTTAAATTTTTLPPKRPTTGDIVILGFIQTLELAATDLYGLAVPKLTGDIAIVAAAFRGHHQAYGEQLGALLGRRAPGVANASVVRERTDAFSSSSAPEILRAMYDLEDSLAASQANVLGDIEGTDGAALLASILPIEARQAVVLGQAIHIDNTELMPLLEGDENGAIVFTPSEYPVL